MYIFLKTPKFLTKNMSSVITYFLKNPLKYFFPNAVLARNELRLLMFFFSLGFWNILDAE